MRAAAPLTGATTSPPSSSFVPVALIVVALALYLWGVGETTPCTRGIPGRSGRTVAFIGALGTTGLSIFSFVGVYDGELFWDHMVQHLLLIMVAAPLFAIASPSGAGLPAPRPARRTWSSPRALRSTVGEGPRPPGGGLRALRRRDPAQPPDHLVQRHAHARERAQRRAPRLPRRGLPVLAPDLRDRPQLLPAPPRPAVLLPLPGHPDRHLHRAVAGRGQQGDVPGLLRHAPHLGTVVRRRPPHRRRPSCGWSGTPSCCGR